MINASTNELRKLSYTELEAKILELRKHQFSLRMKKANGSLENTHLINLARKEVARVKTIMTEKKVGDKS